MFVKINFETKFPSFVDENFVARLDFKFQTMELLNTMLYEVHKEYTHAKFEREK